MVRAYTGRRAISPLATELIVGFGDDLMATGMAKGAYRRGKRIAFGDGRRIIWGPWSAEIFKGNPNVAIPGSERERDIEWIAYYKGHRQYNRQQGDRWVWNYEFRPEPGEVYFDKQEMLFANWVKDGIVVIEPNVPQQKSVAVNKQWPVTRFQEVARQLKAMGRHVVQLDYGGRYNLEFVSRVQTKTFREALAVLYRADLYIGPEGGLHHGAAALGVPAVVLFGGFIPPQVTGYHGHINLTGGAEACGSLKTCQHCRQAMDRISVDEVMHVAKGLLCH